MTPTRPYQFADVPTVPHEAHTRCKRSCCWTPHGHSGAATKCTCHGQEES